jgi:hypothetical protein
MLVDYPRLGTVGAADEPIAVGVHDAGGASELVKAVGERRCSPYLQISRPPGEVAVETDRLTTRIRTLEPAVDQHAFTGDDRVGAGVDRQVVSLDGRMQNLRRGDRRNPDRHKRSERRCGHDDT